MDCEVGDVGLRISDHHASRCVLIASVVLNRTYIFWRLIADRCGSQKKGVAVGFTFDVRSACLVAASLQVQRPVRWCTGTLPSGSITIHSPRHVLGALCHRSVWHCKIRPRLWHNILCAGAFWRCYPCLKQH